MRSSRQSPQCLIRYVPSDRLALEERQAKLEREREKLMEARYAGAVPPDLLKREHDRIDHREIACTSTSESLSHRSSRHVASRTSRIGEGKDESSRISVSVCQPSLGPSERVESVRMT